MQHSDLNNNKKDYDPGPSADNTQLAKPRAPHAVLGRHSGGGAAHGGLLGRGHELALLRGGHGARPRRAARPDRQHTEGSGKWRDHQKGPAT